MARTKKLRMLINLPEGFYKTPELKDVFKRLEKRCDIRRRSWNTIEEISADVIWSQAIIMWSWPKLTEDLLAQAPDLGFIGHINDALSMAKAELKAGLAVSEARRGWSPAVAEMALALILAGLRRTAQYHIQMSNGTETWVTSFPDTIDPLERQLSGRDVGIVGFGGVGQGLADLLKPFKCTIRLFDPYLPRQIAARYGARQVSLMELLKKSDVVVLCAANTEEAAHLIGPAQVAALRKNAVLVNVGRSMLIDMDALAKRLKKGEITAMLDVFDTEPLEVKSAFRSLPNCYCTPHRAGGIIESVTRILNMLADDFEAWLNHKPRAHALNEKSLVSLSDKG